MRHLPLACLLLFALAVPAVAEDVPATEEKSTTIDIAAAAAKWPAPSQDSAFRVELTAVIGENPMGTFLIEVGPAMAEGKVTGWRFHERLELDFGGKAAHGDAVSQASLQLRPISGTSEETFGRTPESMTWVTKDGKLEVTTKEGAKEGDKEGEASKTRTLEVKDWMLPGWAGLFMAARFLPLKAATYRGTDFSATESDDPIEEFTLVVDPAARYEGRKVATVRATRGKKKHFELVVELEDRSIAHGRMWEDGSPMRLTLVPQAAAPEQDDVFARQPRNEIEASAHVLYATTMKDRKEIERLFRWTSMYEAAKEKLEAAGQPVPNFDDYKREALDQMSSGTPGEGAEPGQIKAALQMFLKDVKSTDTPQGWKAVIWPKAFAHILVVMEKKADGWKAIGLTTLSK